jgi:transposase
MKKLRIQYPSEVSREQFTVIQPLLEGACRKTRPRTVDLYEVFCAVLYVLRSGCQWRMVPAGFPKWRTVYAYWRIWHEPGEATSLLEQALKKSGWRGPRQPWAQRHPELVNPGFAKRQEHRQCRTQGR